MFGMLLLAFAMVGVRLVYLQVVAAPALAARAQDQRLRDVEVPARRGTIYDREGEELARSIRARTIYAAPNQVTDPKRTAAAIAKTIGGDAIEYQRKLERDSGFVYIARKVDWRKAAELEALELKGIGFLEDSRRVYPSGQLACQVLGFVGVDDEGLAGIEKQYDELLAGTPGTLLAERDPYGRPIPGGVVRSTDPEHGAGLVLTIDKDIQYRAQLELAKAVKKWNAKGGSVVVMDPRDGAVLAMASTPYFDPNRFREAKPSAVRNRAACDAYEPGSTMKALTAAAVIDEGLFEPDSKFVLPPTIRVGGRTIHEAHGRGTVTWTLTDIVTHSSNVGAVKLGLALGPQGLYQSFKAFGLTERSGLDFPGDAKGYMPPTDQWSASTIGNVPFGQGVSVTPLQLARAISAIANGGVMPTPHLLREVPEHPELEPELPTRRVISPEAAAKTSRMLEAVVTEGTGEGARVAGYSVAGKTGTAQKAREDGRGYAAGKYVGSFIGYLPAEDPQVLVCVTIDEPKGAIYGGVVAAPAFSAIAEFAVSHLGILPPDSSSGDASVTVTGD